MSFNKIYFNEYDVSYKAKGNLDNVIESYLRDFGDNELDGLCKEISSNYTSFFLIVIKNIEKENTHILTDVIRSFSCLIDLSEHSNIGVFEAPLDNFKLCKDESTIKEYITSGVLTSGKTLFKNVITNCAGEILTINNLTKDVTTVEWEPYAYYHNNSFTYKQWVDRTHKAFDKSIDKLVKYSEGRQIVIPLSGGLDSRYIAMLLKRKGYENVVCFTYGLKGNWEARISESIAKKIGYNWHFVEYSHEMWSELGVTDDFNNYVSNCASGYTTPHVQDWPAIKELLEKGVINKGAIVVPGHSTDFLAGSHLENEFFSSKPLKINRFIKIMKEKYFSLSFHDSEHIHKKVFSDYLSKEISCSDMLSSLKAAELFEKWNIKQRQSKFIVNSIKVYESFGLDSYVPMWDYSLVKHFWMMPLDFRKGKRVYISVVNEEQVQYNFEDKPDLSFRFKMFLFRWTKRMKVYSLAMSIRNLMLDNTSRKKTLIIDNMGWFGLFDKEWLKENSNKGDKFYVLLLKFYLDKLGY